MMERMMDDAFHAGDVIEGSFDNTVRRRKQWYALLETVVPKGEKISKLIRSFERNQQRPTREEFLDRLRLISGKIEDNGRAVFIIDPLEYLERERDEYAEEWVIVVRDLPEKIKVVFAQRPEDALVRYRKFAKLGNVERVPRSNLGKLKETAVNELLDLRAGQMSYTITKLRESLGRYEGHPYALQGALDMIATGTKLEELPEDQEVYELRVSFSEPHHVPEPLTDTIYLPRLHGNSSTCEFHFRTRDDVPQFEGRLVVMYGESNRILQTMFLVAQVFPDPVHAPPDAAIELKPETAVRANLSDLGSRKPFDVALVADTGSDGMTHVTGFTSERVELRSLENVEQPIKRMRRRLSRIASSPEDFGHLNTEATQDLLRFLARQGSLLYTGIVRTQIGEGGLLNEEDKRIQLVSARESFLPLEFIYDRPSPLPDARLCPKAKEALETGQCTHCDQLDAEAAKAYICPLGFWCMSRVIERHAVKPVDETNLSGAEYALQSDPISGRDTLCVLDSALYAASNRVKAEQIKELVDTLVDVTDQRADHVKDWDAWRNAVQTRGPSLLVLLPHTLEDDDYIPTLEIGEKQQLPEDQITASHVHAGLGNEPPIVLLLGCETAVPDVPFQGFATQFRVNGAAIVLSTLTPVLGRHAVPVAKILVNELQHAASAKGTFGDALLGLRRRALAAGIPMVLSLVAYGDADWRLES